MRTRVCLLALAALLLGAIGLVGCGPGPQAQARPGAPSDILPEPPPMPTGAPLAPTPTPEAAPGSQSTAGGNAMLRASFEGERDVAGWTVVDASDVLQSPSIWAVKDGRLEQVSDGEGLPGMYPTALIGGDAAWKDYEVSVAAYTTGNDEMGVVARAGEQGYYVFRLLPAAHRQPNRVLARYDAATQKFHTIATANGAGFTAKRWFTLSLRVQGDRIQAFVDGQPALEARDATLTQGRAGVYGYAQGSLTFDNLAVQALPAGQ